MLLRADLAGFWQNAGSSADLQRVIPLDRWDMEAAYAPDQLPGTMSIYSRFAALCTGVCDFDAAAFRMPTAEAAAMDPQQRMLLQTAAVALAEGADVRGQLSSFTGTGSILQHGPDVQCTCMRARDPKSCVGLLRA